ncbi:MAG: HAMP domain-containing protein [Myxococcales bacterium]|nr:HAMP domain-containing protein [Myxococcales bacterium]
MRTLFLRIFLSFWLAFMLIGAAMALVLFASEPSPWAERGRFLTIQALTLQAMELAPLLESGREEELAAALDAFEQRTRMPVELVAGSESRVTGESTREPSEYAEVAAITGEALYTGEPVWRDTSSVDYVAVPMVTTGEPSMVLLARIRHPSSWWRILGPGPVGLRLIIVFVVSGLICFAVARQLTKPLDQLRQATRAVAHERLDVRVSPQVGTRRDEIGALGRDFDLMVDRVQGLLDDQQRLIRDVSHELRSPLARLSVALELARSADVDHLPQHLDRIERESNRLNEMIGDLLDVARIDAQAEQGKREPVDLAALVEQVVADAVFEARGTERTVEIVATSPVTITGYAETLRRAIENVVRNGVRFTDAGTRVSVSVEQSMRGGEEFAIIVVQDRGRGVPDDDLERIFQPFVRVGEARDRKSGGTGIGLAVTQRSVKAHGGTVRAENVEGGGMRVVIELPIV